MSVAAIIINIMGKIIGYVCDVMEGGNVGYP
jgi:hypothetical protein